MKHRLDRLLVDRGLASSRQAAQALIMGGRVTVNGARADKAGVRVDETALVEVIGPAIPYVGRGGVKLEGALDAFRLDVSGLVALDVGASTGGFTDCLLQRGAARVIALDVGRGQLHWNLRRDERVVPLEGINARYLEPGQLPASPDVAVVDVSFISLRLVLPRIPPVLGGSGRGGAAGWILALVKPQFEVGRGQVGSGGIIRSAVKRREVLLGISEFALAEGLRVSGIAPSIIRGNEGNQEYFLHLSTRSHGMSIREIELHVAEITRNEIED